MEEEKKPEYITDPDNQWVPEEEEKKEEVPPTLGINIVEKIEMKDKPHG